MQMGLYGKYILAKSDGTDLDPNACYFVLRWDTDPAARQALRLYAQLCDDELLRQHLLEELNSRYPD